MTVITTPCCEPPQCSAVFGGPAASKGFYMVNAANDPWRRVRRRALGRHTRDRRCGVWVMVTFDEDPAGMKRNDRMTGEPVQVDLDAIRPLAMTLAEFWEIIGKYNGDSTLESLMRVVNNLSWRKLLAYDVRTRLLLREGLTSVLNNPDPTHDDIKKLIPPLSQALLMGQSTWAQTIKLSPQEVISKQPSFDRDAYFNHVENAYIQSHFKISGMLRTNPVALTNGIVDFRPLTASNPWDSV